MGWRVNGWPSGCDDTYLAANGTYLGPRKRCVNSPVYRYGAGGVGTQIFLTLQNVYVPKAILLGAFSPPVATSPVVCGRD